MPLYYFVRHGETEWNAAGRFCGRTDVSLSPVGRHQAKLVTDRLKATRFEAIYSSPLRRALETAAIIGDALGLQVQTDPRVIELSYGVWEGKTREESRGLDPEAYRRWEEDPSINAPPGGETGAQLVERVAPFLSDLPQKHPAGNVVVVGHRTVWRLLICHLSGIPLSEYRKRVPMDNAALNVFEWSEGKWRVLAINDTEHLRAQFAIGPQNL